MKKILALVLAAILLLQLPIMAFAEAVEETPVAVETVEAAPQETTLVEENAISAPETVLNAGENDAIVEPTETAESTTTVEPTENAESTATVEPTGTAETTSTVEPTATLESEATEEVVSAEGSNLDLPIAIELSKVVEGTFTEDLTTIYYAVNSDRYNKLNISIKGSTDYIELFNNKEKIEKYEAVDSLINTEVSVKENTTYIIAINGAIGNSFKLEVKPIEQKEEAQEEKVAPGAIPLVLNGAPLIGKVDTTNAGFLYYVNIPSPGLLTFYTNPTEDAVVSFKNEAMNKDYRIETGKGSIKQSCWLDAGAYHSAIVRNLVDTDYTIRAEFKPANINIINANGPSTAFPVVLSQEYSKGVLTEEDREDMLVFTTTKTGSLRYDSRTYLKNASLAIFNSSLVNIYGKALPNGTDNSPAAFTDSQKLEPGTYYIKIEASDSPGADRGLYDIRFSFDDSDITEVEPNNGYGTANPLIIDGPAKIGNLPDFADDDFFRITVPTSRNVEISARDFTNGLIVELYDDYLTNKLLDLSKANSGGTINSPYYHTGTYYLEANKNYYIKIKANTEKGKYEVQAKSAFSISTLNLTPTSGPLGVTLKITPVIVYGTARLAAIEVYQKVGVNYNKIHSEVALKSSYTYKPAAKGTYRITYLAYNGYRWTYLHSQDIVVEDPLSITGVTFAPGLGNVGDVYTATVTYAGSKPLSYSYEVYNSMGQIAVPLATTNTNNYAVKLNNSGIYCVRVYAHDGVNPVNGFSNWIRVYKPLAVSGVDINSNTNTVGGTMTFSLLTNGGDVSFTNFIVYRDDIQISSQVVTSGNLLSYSYVPSVPGTYKVFASAYDGVVWKGAMSANIVVNEDFQIFAVAPNKINNNVGDTVVFTLTTNQPTVATNYRLIDSKGNAVSTWSGNSLNFAYKFTKTELYLCIATVSNGKTWKTAVSPWVSANADSIQISDIQLSPAPYAIGKPVKVTINTTGTPPVYTKYIVYDNKWNLITSWEGNAKQFIFTPLATGTYNVQVVVSDGSTWKVKNSNWFTVPTP